MRLPAAALPALLACAALAGCASPPAEEGPGGAGGPAAGSAWAPGGSFPAFVPPGEASCPGHWHATFAVYVPGAGGEPDLLDLSLPRLQSGRPYYDFGVAPNMTLAAHLHQTGPELGEARLGPFQMHHEASGRCTGVAQALRSVDVDLAESSLRARGAHRFSGQAGEWNASAAAPLRILVQASVDGNWTWHEADPAQALAYQPRDGEAWLVAIGPFTDAQLRLAADAVPEPDSRHA